MGIWINEVAITIISIWLRNIECIVDPINSWNFFIDASPVARRKFGMGVTCNASINSFGTSQLVADMFFALNLISVTNT